MELNSHTHDHRPNNTLAERGFPLAAMGGAVCGAFAGAALGFQFGSVYPALWGAFGTMLGSVLSACGWSVFVHRGEHFTQNYTNHEHPEPMTSISSAGRHG